MAFWEPESTKSSPRSSARTGAPPALVTASTSTSVSGNSRTARASAPTGLSAPVEVSECTRVTASYRPALSRARTASGSCTPPHGTSRTSTSSPQARAIRAKRPENAPFTSESTRVRAPLRTAASMRPVADDVETRTGRAVPNTSRSPG